MEFSAAIPLVVRAIERLLIVAGGLVLIAMGYTIMRRRSRKEASGEISFQHGSIGSLMIKNQGPGFLAIALGTALLAFSMYHGTITFDPTTGVINRFFATTDANRADRTNEVVNLRIFENLCSGNALPPAANCAKLKASRISLATAYFPEDRAKFDKATEEAKKNDPLFGD